MSRLRTRLPRSHLPADPQLEVICHHRFIIWRTYDPLLRDIQRNRELPSIPLTRVPFLLLSEVKLQLV